MADTDLEGGTLHQSTQTHAHAFNVQPVHIKSCTRVWSFWSTEHYVPSLPYFTAGLEWIEWIELEWIAGPHRRTCTQHV